MPPPQIPGRPVELPQAIEDRAFNAMFRIAGKRNLFFGIVFGRGVKQPENTRVNEIVEIDVNRQIFVNADRDCLYEGQMLQHYAVPRSLVSQATSARFASPPMRESCSFFFGREFSRSASSSSRFEASREDQMLAAPLVRSNPSQATVI